MTNKIDLTDLLEPRHYPAVPMTLYTGRGDEIKTLAEQLGWPQDPPFWAFAWPGGQALAKYTLEHPELVRGKRVCDIGPGTGINSIAAALAGAEFVTAYDTESMSAQLTSLNADMNGVANLVDAVPGYLSRNMLNFYDTVLMGDCFYDAQASFELNALADAAVSANVPFYTGDPIREHFPRRRAKYITEYAIPDTAKLDSRPVTTAYVFELGPM